MKLEINLTRLSGIYLNNQLPLHTLIFEIVNNVFRLFKQEYDPKLSDVPLPLSLRLTDQLTMVMVRNVRLVNLLVAVYTEPSRTIVCRLQSLGEVFAQLSREQ